MSGYYNPLDSLVQPGQFTFYAVVVDGVPNAYFVHKEDAETYATNSFFYPYQGFPQAVIEEYTASPQRKLK